MINETNRTIAECNACANKQECPLLPGYRGFCFPAFSERFNSLSKDQLTNISGMMGYFMRLEDMQIKNPILKLELAQNYAPEILNLKREIAETYDYYDTVFKDTANSKNYIMKCMIEQVRDKIVGRPEDKTR